MDADVTNTAGELAPQRLEETPRVVAATEAGWRRVVVWVADYELVFIMLPVGAAILVNQLPWQWVVASWVVIPLTWGARWIARGRLTVRTPLNVPIAMLMFMAGVALYPSVDLSLTLPILAKMIAGIGLFYAIVNSARSERALWTVAACILLAGVGIAVLSLGNTGWAVDKLFAAPGLYGRLPRFLKVLNPSGFSRNIVGGTLGMLFPLCLALVIKPPDGTVFFPNSEPGKVSHSVLRLFAGLVAVVVGGTTVLAQSRGALAGVGIALFILAIWYSRWTMALIPAGVVGIFLAVQRFGFQALVDFFLITDVTPSAQGRFELWQRAVYMMQDFPYTGIGLGTFSRVAPVLYPFFLIGPDAEVPHAHNLYLQAGVDLGIPGLVASMAIIAASLLVGTRAIHRARYTPLEGLAVGGTCGFIVYLVHGLVDNVTFSAKPTAILWALMGLTTAIWLYVADHPEYCEAGTRG